ncbi:MAG: SMP-30/gluconolactonase/LRE family protein [Pseudomonadota bacterium]
MDIECVWPAGALLGEAPFWHACEKALYWVDVDGKSILRWAPDSGAMERAMIDHEIGCIVPRQDGGFIAGIDSGLAFIGADLTSLEIFASPEAALANTRFNDGKCDQRGRFWVGSTDRREVEPLGALYKVDSTGRVSKMLAGVTVSNGLGWSPDGKIMYFTDSGTSTIYKFDFDLESGSINGRRCFAVADQKDGIPDGLAVDADGFVWSACWGGWQVKRYDPDGKLAQVLKLPVPLITSLAFGGAALDMLCITTARLGLSEAQLREAPLSGGLFVAQVDVPGMPVSAYQG